MQYNTAYCIMRGLSLSAFDESRTCVPAHGQDSGPVLQFALRSSVSGMMMKSNRPYRQLETAQVERLLKLVVGTAECTDNATKRIKRAFGTLAGDLQFELWMRTAVGGEGPNSDIQADPEAASEMASMESPASFSRGAWVDQCRLH